MDRSEDQLKAEMPIEPATSIDGATPNNRVAPVESFAAPSAGRMIAKPIVGHASLRGDLINVLRGFCMGAADTVPGVSGGTIALILGHYRRLVTAISHFDTTLLSLLRRKEFDSAAHHIDVRFLTALGTGILAGVGTLAGVMHWLLDHRLPETLAVFLGLLIASVWIVRSYIDKWSPTRWIALISGAVFAVSVSLLPTSAGSMSLPFLFLSASLAICAMILPGISGALVLVMLGVYHPVTGLIKDAAKGNFTTESLIQIGVFGSGCVIGLLTFSHVLRWMLEHHRGLTMAGLMGLMVGSIGKLWPLQQPTTETAGLEAKFRVMQYVAPQDYSGSLLVLVGLAAAAVIAVAVIERLAVGK